MAGDPLDTAPFGAKHARNFPSPLLDPPNMSDISAAIQEWKDKTITGGALMRRFVQHPRWKVPMSKAAVQEALESNAASRVLYSRDDAGYARLFLFSSNDAVAHYQKLAEVTEILHFLETGGMWVFTLPLEEGIDELVLDAGSPHEFIISKASVPEIGAVARAMDVENALHRLRAGEGKDGDVKKVARHPAFHMAVTKTDAGIRLCRAPDSQERVLAAVFTHRDALELALDEIEDHYAPAQVLTMKVTGPEIFKILDGMAIHGIVFNFSGPGKPVAFAAGLASIMVEEAEKADPPPGPAQ